MTFGERIEYIINELGMNQNSFSKKLGYTNNTQVGEYISGTKPTLPFFEKLLQAIPDISLEWLVGEIGEPFRKNGNIKGDVPEHVYKDLIEKNTRYSLVLTKFFDDYDFYPKKDAEDRSRILNAVLSSNENEKKAIENAKNLEIEKEKLIKEHGLLIKELERDNADLRTKKAKLEEEKDELIRQISSK